MDNSTFMDTVKLYWSRPVDGTPTRIFHMKLERVAHTLSAWSRREFGDILAIVKDYGEKVQMVEAKIPVNSNETNISNLNCVTAEYIKYLKVEQAILKRKSQWYWFKEGDANSKYFYALFSGRKRRLFIRQVTDEQGECIKGVRTLQKLFVHILRKYFKGETKKIDPAAYS